MTVPANIFPEYFKNGQDFIKQYVPFNTKNNVHNFYMGDDEISFNKNLKTQPDDWHYRIKNVEYTINSLGYRTKEFEEIDWKNAIVIIGCSCVFGQGVSDNETISYYLSTLTNREVVNIGVVGASNQFMLDCSMILKKKYGIPYSLIMLWTSTARFPYYGFERVRHVGHWDVDEINEWDIFGRNKNKKFINIFNNLYSEKSHEVITFINIVEISRNIWMDKTNYFEGSFFYESFYYGKLSKFFTSTKSARDLVHPGYINNEITATEIFKLMENNE